MKHLLDIAKKNYYNGETVVPLYGSPAYLTIVDIDKCYIDKNDEGIIVCAFVEEQTDTHDNSIAIYGNGKWTKDIFFCKRSPFLTNLLRKLNIK